MEYLEVDAVQRVDCIEVTDEVIASKIATAWRDFVATTDKISEGSADYVMAHRDMSQKLNAAIPGDCRKAWLTDPIVQDRWGRCKIDVVLDDLVFELIQSYPTHPHLLIWIDKSYWEEFVASKNANP